MHVVARQAEATRILSDARKQMYRLLSEDEDGSADNAGEGGALRS